MGDGSVLLADRAVADVVAEVGADLVAGLSSSEAAARLAADGPNELVAVPPVPAWRRFAAQLQGPLVRLLLGAIVVSVGAWAYGGRDGLPVDALVIAVVLLVNAVLGFVQESRAERAVAALAEMSAPGCTVLRDGRPRDLDATDLVRGDVLLLAEGDAVAADARLTHVAGLRVAEASLTGESAPVTKDLDAGHGPRQLGDRTTMVFKGTAVVQGSARSVVTATGMDTETGAIARLLQETVPEPTPLEVEMAHVGRVLGIAVVVVAVVTMAATWLSSAIETPADAVTVLLLGVSLAVAAVPEGLPAILSVVLSLGVRRMAGHGVLVTRLSAVEALGSASVICSDKTGTLTRNEMTVTRVATASGTVHVSGSGYDPTGSVGDPAPGADQAAEVAVVLSGGAMASDATLHRHDGRWQVLGDPTEIALLVAEAKLGATEGRDRRFTRVAEIPFTSTRKMMSTVEVDHDRADALVLVTKGAPEVLLPLCDRVRVGGGVVPLDDARRAGAAAEVARMSGEALRTLSVAYRRLGTSGTVRQSDVGPDSAAAWERGLVLAGTVGIIDPAREEVAPAVAEAGRAGVRVVMITGDHPGTALAVARELGIPADERSLLTGADLESLDDDGLRARVGRTSVYARVAPAHKLRIVHALQSQGHVVAMTGDGVNDAPALKAADVGVAMGITGTEVTKESAAMILVDDDFATIVVAVRQGRTIFDNLTKVLRYLLSSNMGEVIAVFGGVVLAGVIGLDVAAGDAVVVPLLATQILWINLVTDSGPALALGVDPGTDDVMGRAPRGPDDRVVDARTWGGVLLVGTVIAASTLLTIDVFLPGGLVEGDDTLEVARTAGFTTLVLAQLFNAFSARSRTSSALRGLLANRWLWASVLLAALAQVAVVEVPVLQVAFGTRPLDGWHWLVCVVLASSVLWVEEARKSLLRWWVRSR